MDSKAPVVVLVAIILMGVTIWVVWAIRTSGGISPERKETLAKEAERECVLQGFPPEICPKLVGQNHRQCLESIPSKIEEKRFEEEDYIDCMLEAFGDPQAYRDASSAGGEEAAPDAGTAAEVGPAGDAAADGDAEASD